MRHGLAALTEREKETLRLLVAGHDAKSIARHLGLSVHTVNERLRDARRKLDVSSSREAARLLAEAEQATPDFVVDKRLGVPPIADEVPSPDPAARRPSAAHRLVWFGGGMLVMSLIIAAVILSSALHGGAGADTQAGQGPAPAAASPAADKAGTDAARGWLALLDRQQWDESWRIASTVFRTQLAAAQWVPMAQQVRQPLGSVSARTFLGANRTSSLPGAPAGDYQITQFRTDFAHKAGAIETVVLAREGTAWKVAGYFIK